MKKIFVLVFLILSIIFAALPCFAQGNQMYFNTYADLYIEAGNNNSGFFASDSAMNNVLEGSFTFPSFLSVSQDELGRWHLGTENAKAGDEGVITCISNGNTYSMKIYINLPEPSGGEHGAWNGVNYTPSADQIKEVRPLYIRGSYAGEGVDWLYNITNELCIIPDNYCRGIRLYTNESNAKVFNCIRREGGYSFPDFVSMYLDRGGQWNYTTTTAKVGDTGTMSFFENGILYTATIRVVDPGDPSTYQSDFKLTYTAEELEAAEKVISRDMNEKILAQVAMETVNAIAEEKAQLLLEMRTSEIESETITNEISEDLSKVEECVNENETVAASFDINIAASIKDTTTLTTLEKDIPVTETQEPVEIVLSCEEIKDSAVRVIRVHEDVAEELPIKEINREEGTLTVESDKFSVYSILTSKQVEVRYLDKISYVDFGSVMQAPADAEMKGYKLTGWYYDENLTDAVDFAAPLYDHLTIYPSYEKISYIPIFIGIAAAVIGAYVIIKHSRKNTVQG